MSSYRMKYKIGNTQYNIPVQEDLANLGGGGSKVIGEIVTSTIPQVDASLHLLDGDLLQGSGIYSDFVDYMRDLYEEDPTNDCFMQPYYNAKPNGTIVGTTVTCEDGILSGFSSQNYFIAMSDFSPGSYDWEIVFKFITGTDVSSITYLCGSSTTAYDPFSFRIKRGNFAFECCSGSSSLFDATGTYAVQANTTYVVRCRHTGTTYTLEYSTDNGATFTTDISRTTSSVMSSSNSFILGGESSSSAGNVTSSFQGSIDLSGCYVSINNETVWMGLQVTDLTAEEAWQRMVTDFGVCNKFIYDSVNNTVRLPKSSSQKRYLVKTYSNGSQWYRIYSDGWCEQGGISGKGSGGRTITLPIPFRDRSYTVFMCDYDTAADTDGHNLGPYVSDRAKNFDETKFYVSVISGLDLGWMAVGYIDMVDEPVTPVYEYICVGTSTKTPVQVDMDNIATDLNTKSNRALSNLSSDGEDHFLSRDFCYVYPNGGSESSPANVTSATRYLMNNPFPGYLVHCVAEVLINNQWGITGQYTSNTDYFGVMATQFDSDKIVVQSLSSGILSSRSNEQGNPFGIPTGGSCTSAPCRIKVWKIGKIPT